MGRTPISTARWTVEVRLGRVVGVPLLLGPIVRFVLGVVPRGLARRGPREDGPRGELAPSCGALRGARVHARVAYFAIFAGDWRFYSQTAAGALCARCWWRS